MNNPNQTAGEGFTEFLNSIDDPENPITPANAKAMMDLWFCAVAWCVADQVDMVKDQSKARTGKDVKKRQRARDQRFARISLEVAQYAHANANQQEEKE
jgi:hypothetical protein